MTLSLYYYDIVCCYVSHHIHMICVSAECTDFSHDL